MDAAGLARSLEDSQALTDRKARFGELGTFINTARRLEDLLPGAKARLLALTGHR